MQNDELKFEIPVKNEDFFNQNAVDNVLKPKPIPEPGVIIGLLFVLSFILWRETIK